MPSLHACDSLIVGIVLCRARRGTGGRRLFWTLWPAWVWFAVMATGNHFWLDCVAGMFVALTRDGDRLQAGRDPAAPSSAVASVAAPARPEPLLRSAAVSRAAAIKHGYTPARARSPRARSAASPGPGSRRTRSPRAASLLCAAAVDRRPLREPQPDPLLLARRGPLRRRLAARHPRRRARPRRRQVDALRRLHRLDDRPRQRGVHARRDRLRLRARQPTTSSSSSPSPRSPARSSSPTPAPAPRRSGCKGDVGIGSRAERVVVITAGLVLAPWGVLPWAIVAARRSPPGSPSSSAILSVRRSCSTAIARPASSSR